MAEKNKDWKTAITKIEQNRITIHGYAVDELMEQLSFAEALYLILKGQLPGKKNGKIINTLLVSSIDHGVTPPSVLAALTCASTGGNLSQCMASGILSINQFHGGAIENCQRTLLKAMELKKQENTSIEEAGKKIVQEAIHNKKRLSGFGHRIHTNDPRTARLFKMLSEMDMEGDYIKLIKVMESSFEEIKGKKLPINVDGAIAAVLCELDFEPELGNAFFMIARMPGILAHVTEERKRQKPMRRINPLDYQYDGPEYRPLKNK